ncbi:hypothetical protein [Paraherbaspirillum soli]|uniref:DUF1843 domain-containing protein n=1 Tax=Paraherbaspirillum soli TaxID=631222 RepID=A0ABW0M4H0_9BURK
MHGNNSSPPSPASPAIAYLNIAVDIARFGMHSANDSQRILKAIRELSKNNDVVRDLAQIGIDQAKERHQIFDIQRKELEREKAGKP